MDSEAVALLILNSKLPMPRHQPTLSWQDLRKLTERWSWIDPRTGVRVTGFNPPDKAKEKRQVAYYIRYLTLRGVVEEGEVITLKVFLHGGQSGKGAHQRMIQFTASRQVRRICDILILEIDGIRIIAQ